MEFLFHIFNHDYRHDAAVFRRTCFRLDRFQVKNLDRLDLLAFVCFNILHLGLVCFGSSSVEVYIHAVIACGFFCMVA